MDEVQMCERTGVAFKCPVSWEENDGYIGKDSNFNPREMSSFTCNSNGGNVLDALDKLLALNDGLRLTPHDLSILISGLPGHSSQAKTPTKSILKKGRASSLDVPSSIFMGTEISKSRHSNRSSDSSSRRRVSFDSVDIRSYDRCAGDNPSCRHGVPVSFQARVAPRPPIHGWLPSEPSVPLTIICLSPLSLLPQLSLDWNYTESHKVYELDDFEIERHFKRSSPASAIHKNARRNILAQWGHDEKEFKMRRQETKRVQRQRAMTRANVRVGEIAANFKSRVVPNRKLSKCKILNCDMDESYSTTNTYRTRSVSIR